MAQRTEGRFVCTAPPVNNHGGSSVLPETCGYAGEILRVDLSNREITRTATADYGDRFIGGRGLAAKIYWDEISPRVSAFDPENRLIFVTGPLGGLGQLAGSRWQACGKSPLGPREHFGISNFGGSWGAYLKFAGFDAVVVHGRAEKPVYLFVHQGKAEIRDAGALWGRDNLATRATLKAEHGDAARVLSCGPAGENLVPIATLLAENDASGGDGLAAVMGAKNLKAVVVAGESKISVARPDELKELIGRVKWLKRGAPMVQPLAASPTLRTRRRACWGCVQGCVRSFSVAEDGSSGKTMCAAATYYQARARQFYGEWTDVSFHANRLADALGLDAFALIPLLMWLDNCRQAGVLSDEAAGLPLSQIGSLEFIEKLLHGIARREGIGEVLGWGTDAAAPALGGQAEAQVGDYVPYDPRIYVSTGVCYATETRWSYPQLHEICRPLLAWVAWRSGVFGTYVTGDVVRAIGARFWGSENSVNYATDEGKADCAKRVQDRVYVKESLGLCDNTWPILMVEGSPDHVGDPSLESQVYAAVTGREIDEAGLNQAGERIFNLQRAVLVREGRRGRLDDRLPEFCHTHAIKGIFANPDGMVPGPGEDIIYRKGKVVERAGFDKIMDEYYSLRGWQPESGLQTAKHLSNLGLGDIAADLAPRGQLATDAPPGPDQA